MANNSNDLIAMGMVIAALLIAIFLAAMTTGQRSDFNQPISIASIEKMIAEKDLKICAQGDLNWSVNPGFVSGKYFDISTNCSGYDPNKPGARVWVAEYGNLKARDLALRNFENTRRHIGSGSMWSKGPLVILVDGNQKNKVVSALREALGRQTP